MRLIDADALLENLKVFQRTNIYLSVKDLIKNAPTVQQSEPFGYFKAEPFGWTDCAETDEGAIALYEAPTVQREGWVSDANRYHWLKEQVGFVRGATDNVVTIFEDDATYMFLVKVGKYYKCTGISLDDAIDNAIKAAPTDTE